MSTNALLRYCRHPGCRAVTTGRFCGAHQADERAYDTRRGNSAARGYGARWKRLRLLALARNPVCQTPGCNEPATDVDHIVPKSRGGADDLANLQCLCHACHSRKTATKDGGGWRRR